MMIAGKLGSAATMGVSVIGLMTFAGLTPASAAPDAKPCAYSESGGRAWYNHCTSDGSHVQIMVTLTVGGNVGPICVKPGENDLGPSWRTKGAFYNGKLCSPAATGPAAVPPHRQS
ncbi:DUF6355 family natural product biosynthesis protein [Streptomyces sp. NPDC059994]|uniref:DUF6355 family natural product biosynthesis protein n=1 Tax=Streptomyces sp. NPDC059994 TaxID=3347029 RepID=UPI0036833A70